MSDKFTGLKDVRDERLKVKKEFLEEHCEYINSVISSLRSEVYSGAKTDLTKYEDSGEWKLEVMFDDYIVRDEKKFLLYYIVLEYCDDISGHKVSDPGLKLTVKTSGLFPRTVRTFPIQNLEKTLSEVLKFWV